MKTGLLAILTFSLFFTSCEKILDKEPCVLRDYNVTTNSPVYEGTSIKLKGDASSSQQICTWKGPNGLIPSSINQIEIPNAKYSDSGIYKVEIVNADGCVEYVRASFIKIIPTPIPTCSPTNNTSTTNIAGVGGNTYNYVRAYGSVFDAYPSSFSQNNGLHFVFNTSPTQGVYKTNGSTIASGDEKVGCWIMTTSNTFFVNKADQLVFVNIVNGKTQITFCNAEFTNPLGSAIVRISAKVTAP